MAVKEWQVALAVGAVSAVGGLAVALGFQSPTTRLAKVEGTVADHETRIQKLEDQSQTIEAIARAVGAEIPVKRGK